MSNERVWAVIPAAGIGSRMESDLPKQYLTIEGRTVLEHTLNALFAHPELEGVVVVLHPSDTHFASIELPSDPPVKTVLGGAERSDSVLNGLRTLRALPTPPKWALIHDAARPCLDREELDRLLKERFHSPHGVLLGYPSRDTMKRVDPNGEVVKTVDRSSLWHALTPQLFPLDKLISAHETLLNDEVTMTDDAMAMEYIGHSPRVITGSELNIKVTRPDDLILAETILNHLALRGEGE